MATLTESLDRIQEAAQTIVKEIKSVKKAVGKTDSIKEKEMKDLMKTLDKFKATLSGKEATPKKAKSTAKRGESGKIVLDLVAKNKDGISVKEITETTGLAYGTVNQILNKAKKEKKVDSPKRGVYVIAEPK